MSRRLNVMVVAEWYPSADHPVAGAFVRDQARAVADLHELTVLVHDAGPPRGLAASCAAAIEDGLATIRVRTAAGPGTAAGRVAFVAAATRLLARRRAEGRPVELLHAHVFSAGVLAWLMARGRMPVVLSEHHSDFIEGTVRGRDALLGGLAMRRAALVCPVSAVLERHLRTFEPRGRYEVVPNVVDVDPFLEAGRLHGPEASRPRRLVAVGLLTRHKGIEYLLRALPGVRGAHGEVTLDVLGDGPLRPGLEHLAAATCPPGVVAFHGLQGRDRVAAVVGAADVLVAPSVVESFGVVLIEALAAGIPVVTTREVGLADEVLARGIGWVVPARDVQALEEALADVLARLDAFPAEEARRHAQGYRGAAVARRWDDIYTRLVGPS